MIQAETKIGHSISVNIEKLDGGFISDISGKRRIYKNALDIDDAIDIKNVLTHVEENDYILSIDLIPKEAYVCRTKGEEMITSNPIGYEDDGSLSILDKAKRDGIIQPADVFNPEPAKPVVDTTKPIAVTVANCYTIAQLQAVPWAKYDKEYPLTCREKSDISGIVGSTMYNLWIKVEAGTFQWQSINTRIGMTVLAQYYERKAEKKIRKDDGLPPRNDKRLMEVVTEIELLCKGGLIKPNILMKKVDQFKKLLIQD